MTTEAKQKCEPDIDDATVDKYLDAILRASGSALRHYSLQKPIDEMRAAVRAAMNHHQHP